MQSVNERRKKGRESKFFMTDYSSYFVVPRVRRSLQRRTLSYPIGFNMFVAWMTLLCLAYGVYIYFISKRKNANPPPGPRPWPLVGNLFLVWPPQSSLAETVSQLVKEYCVKYKDQKLFVLRLFTRQFVFVFEPNECKAILKNIKVFDKGPEAALTRKYIGYGILNSPNDTWKAKRKLHNPAFTTMSFRNLMPVLQGTAIEIMKVLELNMDTYFDIKPLMRHYIVKSTSKFFFTHDITKSMPQAVTCFEKSEALFAKRVANPVYSVDWIFHRTEAGRKLLECKKVIFDLAAHILDENEKERRSLETVNQNLRKRTLIDELIDARSAGQISYEDALDEIVSIMVAAHDTTTFALCMALHFLANHEAVQKKVRKEIEDVFGDANPDEITIEQLNQLVYCECVLYETLRIKPMAIGLTKASEADFELMGHTFSKGTTVIFPSHGLAHNPDVFPEPEKFLPERFLVVHSENMDSMEDTQDDVNLNNARVGNIKEFMPFSWGPRSCIGQRFALYEMKTMMVYILKRFHLKAEIDTDKIEISVGGVAAIASKVNIRFTAL